MQIAYNTKANNYSAGAERSLKRLFRDLPYVKMKGKIKARIIYALLVC